MATTSATPSVMPLGLAALAVLAGSAVQLQMPRLLQPVERTALLAGAVLAAVLAVAGHRRG
ncbi:MAG: hypothetical protein QG612_1192, partial [Pseudomonadota bacterium]|nr:hypothetical protein [Pseudomonadota bacterium]